MSHNLKIQKFKIIIIKKFKNVLPKSLGEIVHLKYIT